MKRTLALSALAVTIGCALMAHRASAQAPSDELPVDAAKQRYREAVGRATSVAKELLGQAGELPAAKPEALREKLRPLVEESFDARQRLQQAELKELRRRLVEIEQAISTREENKEVIINSRIDELFQAPVKSKSLPLLGSPDSAETAPPGGPPPGTVARVRYVQEQAEVNGELKTITRPVTEYVRIQGTTVPQPDDADDESSVVPHGKAGDEPRSELDLATRERLAQLDVQTAEEELEAAKEKVRLLGEMFDKGAATARSILESKKEQREAVYQFKRAKLKLEGLAARRVELEAAAEAAVAEMLGERQKAAATVASAEANLAATSAQKEKMGADIDAAKANYAFREKNYARMQQLFAVKSIEAQVLDEAEEQRAAAKAALLGANSAVATAKANIDQAKSAVKEAQAAFNVAELRLQAAQARRDRLIQRPAPEKPAPQGPQPDQSRIQDKASE